MSLTVGDIVRCNARVCPHRYVGRLARIVRVEPVESRLAGTELAPAVYRLQFVDSREAPGDDIGFFAFELDFCASEALCEEVRRAVLRR